MKKYQYLGVGLIVAVVITGSFLISSFFSSHWAQIYYDRLFSIQQCLHDGQIPCRWVMSMELNYGSPTFNYIGPLPYYLGALIYLLVPKVAMSVKLLFGVGCLGSYFFSFLLVRKFRSERVAMVSGLIYLGLMLGMLLQAAGDPLAKLWTFMLIPGVLLAVNRLRRNPSLLNSLLLAVFTVGLMLSRLANLTQLLPLLLVLLGLIWWGRFSRRFMIYALIGVGLGLWLGAFYLLPMTTERSLAFLDPATQAYVPQSSAIIPSAVAVQPYLILAGQTQVFDYSSGSDRFVIQVSAEEHSIVRINQFYYPDWVIKVDGREVNPNFGNNSLGLITVLLGKGDYQKIEGQLRNTPVRVIGNWLSVVGVVVFGFLLLFEMRRPRKWILYYLNALNW